MLHMLIAQVWEYVEPGDGGRERKKSNRRGRNTGSITAAPPAHPGVIGDRARLLRSKEEEVEDEDDAWSIDEGIHVEDFPGEELSVRLVTGESSVDNSEWTDLVNKTVDFVFD